MIDDIQVFCHSSIKFNKNKIIYFDPYNIDEYYKDADYVFITHDHYDHYSIEDLKKVIKEDTQIVVPESMLDNVLEFGFKKENIILVLPNQEYNNGQISFSTVSAYNINKLYHPKENNWVGYIIELENIKYYIAGDTDMTPENRLVKCDVAFIPVGGKFTMDFLEAASLVNTIKPKIAIPIHYGSIVGTKDDAINFKNNLDDLIECEILIEVN